MFILHSSNKTENLLEHLLAVLNSRPLASVLAPEIFLIQSLGMERWLSQQLAQRSKVWSNYRYLFPLKFFNTLTGALFKNENTDDFDRHLLVWRFEALLRDTGAEEFKPLRYFLSGANAELKRFQLARQLTGIFDQYQIMRADMLDVWGRGGLESKNDSERWQAGLWRALIAEIGGQHRGEQWRKAILYLRQAASGELNALLPERISVFGVNSMPPLLLAYLQALGGHCDVHLYLLNPVQIYWADLPSKRLQAELAEFQGHPLLISLGQQGREFQQLLLEQVDFQFEPSSFEAGVADSNLQHLQNDLLNNQVRSIALQADGTIVAHACHSRLREVQVLKDQLLAALAKDPRLELRDIVVMAPDIQLYAPFISAVFSDIQHAIADRSLHGSNALLNALLRFLNLSQSRFGWRSVLYLLEEEIVYVNFGLSEDDMVLIRYWIRDTQVRWGESAAHKRALDLPDIQQNTWQAALDRLFMGYALAEDAEFVDGVLPYPDIEGSASQALGGLNDFLHLLFQAADALPSARTLSDWRALLIGYSGQLFGDAYSPERQELNELLEEMREIAGIHSQPVACPVIVAWMEGRLRETNSVSGFLRGQLTFCSMLPMRSIPFQIIALLGMNDGEFPKIERSPDFDLIAKFPRLGDRSRRADDRYQFLEILLSARRQLIITYIGLSQQNNSPIPPSVIVSELLDVLRDCYRLELITTHPLHAFSSRYFDGGQPRLFSYSRHDYAVALGLRAGEQPFQPWWRGRIAVEDAETVAVDELLSFYNHPQRFFLRRQLGLFLPQLDAEPEEREPFTLDTLEQYKINQQWLAELLAGGDAPLAKLQARGCWPAGTPGELAWRLQRRDLQVFAAGVLAKNPGNARPALAVDFKVGRYRLSGKLEHIYSNCGLFYRYSTLKGKDFMTAWLHHLLINRIQPQTTYLLSIDADLSFAPEIADQRILEALLDIFVQGKQAPDAFFTDASFWYLQQSKPELALNAVIKKMLAALEQGYEPEIAQLLAGRDLNLLFNADFARRCDDLLKTAWRRAHGL
ncbi:MAG: exodeoxyribonuclease V subunit gamma [Methylomonas sp.]